MADGKFVPDPVHESEKADPTATKRAQEEEFLTQLDEFEQQGRHVSYKPTARNYAPTVFSRSGGKKKEVYEDTMERLFKQRRIRSVPYGKPSDKTEQIVRCDSSGATILNFPDKGKPKDPTTE